MAAAAVGFGCRCIFLEKKISSIYFSKIKEKKYKKIQESRSPFWRDGLLMRMLCFFYVLIVFFGLLNNIK
jgi:hypothetical protein